MAFRGTFDHSLDAKNRLTVPSKFRAALAEGVVLAKGVEPCVAIWPPEDFERHVERARSPACNPLSTQARKLDALLLRPTRSTPSSTAPAA